VKYIDTFVAHGIITRGARGRDDVDESGQCVSDLVARHSTATSEEHLLAFEVVLFISERIYLIYCSLRDLYAPLIINQVECVSFGVGNI